MKTSALLILLSFSVFSCSKPEIEDIIVIGGGLMGSSTAWHLSGQGLNVLLIEMQDSAYTYGYSCVYSLTDSEVPLVTPILDEENRPVRTSVASLNQAISTDLIILIKNAALIQVLNSHIKQFTGFKKISVYAGKIIVSQRSCQNKK